MNAWKTWLAITTLLTTSAPLAFTGCAPLDAEMLDEEDAEDAEEVSDAVSCYPQMSVFPVGAAHNIGYDSSCNDGTCDISCPDQRANSDWGGSHHGIDVFAYKGAPLVAVADGTVVKVGVVSSTSGLRVRLRDACGWEYYYGHLDAAFVTPGQVVSAGDVLGTMGNSGTGGVHLHFNVSPDGNYSSDINPFDLLGATSHTACEAPPPPPPPPAPGELCGLMGDGGTLGEGQAITSCDGRFSLVMQTDGNLVVYQGNTPLWHTGTHGTDASHARLINGRLSVRRPSGAVLWQSTGSAAGAFLSMQSDGNLVIYRQNLTPVWNSQTCCH